MNNVYDHMISIITALRDGKTIQYWNNGKDDWTDFDVRGLPGFNKFEYRIKPKEIHYRVALFKDENDSHYPMLITNNEVAEKIENDENDFVRWITDWVKYEVR